MASLFDTLTTYSINCENLKAYRHLAIQQLNTASSLLAKALANVFFSSQKDFKKILILNLVKKILFFRDLSVEYLILSKISEFLFRATIVNWYQS